MSVRVGLPVSVAGAAAVLGAGFLAFSFFACVGSDPPPPVDGADAASDASVPTNTGSADTGAAATPCTCVDAPPDGWSVPGYLLRNATCASPVPNEVYKLYADVRGAPATCGQCRCKGPPTSASCTSASIASYTSGTCPAGAPTGAPLDLTGAGCFENPNATITSYRAATGLVQGSCEATTDTIPDIPAVEKTDVHLCASADQAAGTCEAGTVCQPAPPPAATPLPLCVAHAGDLECPSSYPVRQRLNASYEDKRRCTTCSCSFSGSGCTYTVKAYSGTGCTGTLQTTATSGSACLTGSPKSFRVTAGTVTDPACGNPHGGEATGEVVLGDVVTVCCKP